MKKYMLIQTLGHLLRRLRRMLLLRSSRQASLWRRRHHKKGRGRVFVQSRRALVSAYQGGRKRASLWSHGYMTRQRRAE